LNFDLLLSGDFPFATLAGLGRPTEPPTIDSCHVLAGQAAVTSLAGRAVATAALPRGPGQW